MMIVTPVEPVKIQYPPSEILSDEPPLETERHLQQIFLLLACLKWWWRERPNSPQRDDFYAAGNLSIYYSPRQKRSEDFRGPDFFVVLGTEYKERKSWVVWEEGGKYPNVIVEMLSETTAKVDRGEKKEIYQDVFRTPEYFWFDPYSMELKGWVLKNGEYGEIEPNQQGWLWSKQLELYVGKVGEKLRFLTATGELVPTPSEAAIAKETEVVAAKQEAYTERQRAQEEHQQAEAERQRAEQQTQWAQEERQRAEAERQRAEEIAAELENLRHQLKHRGINLNES